MSSIIITPENINIQNNSGGVFDTDYRYLKTSTQQIPANISGAALPVIGVKPDFSTVPQSPDIISFLNRKNYPQTVSNREAHLQDFKVMAPIYYYKNTYGEINPGYGTQIADLVGPVELSFTVPTNIQNIDFAPYGYYTDAFQNTTRLNAAANEYRSWTKGQTRDIKDGQGNIIGTYRWFYEFYPFYHYLNSDVPLSYSNVVALPFPIEVNLTGEHDGTVVITYDEHELVYDGTKHKYNLPEYEVLTGYILENVFWPISNLGIDRQNKCGTVLSVMLVGRESDQIATLSEA